MSRPGNIWRRVHGHITGRPTNFSWIISNTVAGSGLPTTLEEFNWLRDQGIRAIVSTTEVPLPAQWTKKISYLHIPTPDMTAPRSHNIDAAVDFMFRCVQQGQPVMVHCAAGLGRTGTVLACYMVKHQGMNAEQAIKKIRDMRPGSIQSSVQEQAVFTYYKKS